MLGSVALAAAFFFAAPLPPLVADRSNPGFDPAAAPKDTVPAGRGPEPRTRRRLFERRVLFSADYLDRLISLGSRAPAAGIPPVVVSAPGFRGQAGFYARKYRIDEELALQIIEVAIAQGLDPDLGFRLIRVESVFDPDARGMSGSLGLTQLMPSTARSVDRSLRTEAAILDPANNLRVGFRHLRSLIERYNGNVRLALLAYNRGTGTVDRAIRQGRDPENGYTRLVLELNGERYAGRGLIDVAREPGNGAPGGSVQ